MENNLGIFQMTDKDKTKKPKKKEPKKRSSKYQKKLTLHGMDEKEVLKKMLETPPLGKTPSEGKE